MLNSGQIRAARAFLGWSARELGERASVHLNTVQRIERNHGPVRANTESLHRIERTLEAAGIEFHIMNGCPGVTLRGSADGEADHAQSNS